MTREEAIRHIRDIICENNTVKHSDMVVFEAEKEALYMAIQALSQEHTGHWNLLDECANSGYYCSECQKKLVKEGWSKTVKKIKYCPNCGAKMERSKNT